MDEMTLTLNSPLTEEQLDAIMDVDLENTPRIMFHTKNGQEVLYEKRKMGRWIPHEGWDGDESYECSECKVLGTFPDGTPEENGANFCHNCGAYMRG